MISEYDLLREGSSLHDRFGAERADEFGRELPGLVAELTERWGLCVEGFLDSGATSIVLAVSDRFGAQAVLKLSPDHVFLARQVGMLQHFASTGRVPAVLESEREAGAVMLERVLPGDPIDSVNQMQPTVQEWGTLLRDLHGTTTDAVTDRLDDRCEEMFVRIGARQATPQVRAIVSDAVWEATVVQCRELLRTGEQLVTIHGDLHLGNVLASDARGLVAIDPKLCVGDPCFDMVDFVVAQGGPEEMTARAEHLAADVEVSRDRLLTWSKVNAVVTAISLITWYGPDQRSDDLLTFAEVP